MSQENSKYVVVEFPEDEGECPVIGIISNSWIFEQDNNVYCYWPTCYKTDSSRDKAVKKHEVLNFEGCDTCPIVIKYTTDNYDKARKKMKDLQEYSQVETSSDEDQRTRKRTVKKKTQEDFLETLSDMEEAFPILNIAPPKKKLQTSTPNMEEKNKMKKNFQTNSQTFTPNVEERYKTKQTSNSQTLLPNMEERNKTKQTSKFQTLTPERNSVTHRKMEKCIQCSDNKKMLTEVLEQLSVIKDNINFLMEVCGRQADPTSIPPAVKKLEELEELENFNTTLNDPSKFTEACRSLSYVGGKDVGETTRKILSKLISNKLAIKTNWTGRNDKIGMKQMANVNNLILVSVRKNPLCNNVTLDNVENIIKAWLRTAYDRDGGGRSRRKKEIGPNE